jgi:ABC-type transport system involved in cytochrome c biogenesis permease subunit
MLEWIADKILAIVTFVPALFVAEDSPQFMLVRSMFALALIPLIIFGIAMLPSRAVIARYLKKNIQCLRFEMMKPSDLNARRKTRPQRSTAAHGRP